MASDKYMDTYRGVSIESKENELDGNMQNSLPSVCV